MLPRRRKVDDIHYDMFIRNTLGRYLPDCLSEVTEARPADPIEYISSWLYRAYDSDLYFQEKEKYLRDVDYNAKLIELEKMEKRARMDPLIRAIDEEKLRLTQAKREEMEALFGYIQLAGGDVDPELKKRFAQLQGLFQGEDLVMGIGRDDEGHVLQIQIIDGHTVEGCVIDGQFVEGRIIDGHFVQGHFINGQFVQGKWVDGQFIEGKWVNGQFLEGRWINGQFVEGRFINGEFIQGRWIDDQFVEGKWVNGVFIEGKWIDGKLVEGKWIDGEFIEGRWVDGEFVAGMYIDGEFVEGRMINGQFVEGIFIDGQFVEGTMIDGEFVGGRFIDGEFVEGRMIDGHFVEGSWQDLSARITPGGSVRRRTGSRRSGSFTDDGSMSPTRRRKASRDKGGRMGISPSRERMQAGKHRGSLTEDAEKQLPSLVMRGKKKFKSAEEEAKDMKKAKLLEWGKMGSALPPIGSRPVVYDPDDLSGYPSNSYQLTTKGNVAYISQDLGLLAPTSIRYRKLKPNDDPEEWEKRDFRCESHYDHELYTVCDAYIEDYQPQGVPAMSMEEFMLPTNRLRNASLADV